MRRRRAVGRHRTAQARSQPSTAPPGGTRDEELPTQLSGGLTSTPDAVYAGGADGVVYGRGTAPGGRLFTTHAIGQRIHALAANSRGLHVGGADGGMISFDFRGRPVPPRTPPHDGQVWACRSEPGANLLASASVDGVVRVDDVATSVASIAQSGTRSVVR